VLSTVFRKSSEGPRRPTTSNHRNNRGRNNLTARRLLRLCIWAGPRPNGRRKTSAPTASASPAGLERVAPDHADAVKPADVRMC